MDVKLFDMNNTNGGNQNNNNLRNDLLQLRLGDRKAQQCPRCGSQNTKFGYYNNYSLNQPRHYCRSCKRHWTKGGVCRNVPIGGARRRNRRPSRVSPAHPTMSPRGRGNGRMIESNTSAMASVTEPFETRFSAYSHATSSFTPRPLLQASMSNMSLFSLNSNINDNVSLGSGNFQSLIGQPALISGGDPWQQESTYMNFTPHDHIFLWGGLNHGASGSGSVVATDGGGIGEPPTLGDIDVINYNIQWADHLLQFSPPPPPPPSA